MEQTAEELQKTIEQLRIQCGLLDQQNGELMAKLKWYEEQFRLSKERLYGASSEKTDSEQMELQLFNEAEVVAHLENEQEQETAETVTYQRKKKRGKRSVNLDHLPVETVDYELPTSEQICSSCGHELHEMSTEVRQELEVIPAEVKVLRHVRHVYACRHCEHHELSTPVVTAEAPKPVFPKSLASPSAMAYTMSQKYVESQPLYRQEQHFARFGVTISRQNLANWIIYGAETWLKLLYDRMVFALLQRDILHADETPFQILREEGRSPTAKSYLWLYRTGREQPAIVLYEYQPSRKGEHPRNFLSGFTGYLQVDGYSGYHKVADVTLIGCWAHARRKFSDTLKALPESAKFAKVTATEGLNFCNQLFAIERKLKDLSGEQRYKFRLEHSKPVLEAFSVWLHHQVPKVLPKSALGQAISYCRKQWDKLEGFLKDGRLELDNNRAERSIKPFVIGRRNWLFANTPKGAKASAIIYSVVETAKENGLQPFQYLKYLFEKLPNIDTSDLELLDQLLPWSTTLPEVCRVPNTSN